jgi:TolB-like protein/DNA-binding winged helix-turn-helix (wHTH) protein/Flp pilus assembly protein TadD
MVDEGAIYAFAGFTLDSAKRRLLVDGRPATLNARAFDILLVLLDNADRTVTKEEILTRVWGEIYVEENNLAVQISVLRKALSVKQGGAKLILTVPGRGYRFVGQLERPAAEPAAAAPPAAVNPIATPTAPEDSMTHKGWRRWLRDRRRMAMAGTAIVVALAAVITWLALQPARAPAPRLSIVVLPFRNLGGDPKDDYLADAVSDDLTTDLSHLPGSIVIARQSADLYRGRAVGAERIGADLGVRYLLEGSVRRVDQKLLINAQLIDSSNGAHLWADRFDTSTAQLAEAQAAIVGRIASALDFTLVQIEGRRSYLDRPSNPDALDFFFRGRSILDRDNSFDGLLQSQSLFERAIALQPNFAEAMSDLAGLLLIKVRDYDDPTLTEDMTEAETWLDEALAIAPDNAHALATRGLRLALDKRFDEAAQSYRLALSFDPNSVEARLGLARCANAFGHPEEAVGLIQAALQIDPVNPQNRNRFHQLGMALLLLGRADEAIPWLQKAAVGEPNTMEDNEMALIAAYSEIGRAAEAHMKFLAYNDRWPHRSSWRIGCLATSAISKMPGFERLIAGLEAAGMPRFIDEAADDGVQPQATPRAAGDLEPSPTTIPGARTIATAEFSKILAQGDGPQSGAPQGGGHVVLDVGCGAAVPLGAIWPNWLGDYTSLSVDERDAMKRDIDAASHGRAQPSVIVMGSGAYGWDAYNAALAVLSLGYRNVLWYRGGEEALAAASLPHEDRRKP